LVGLALQRTAGARAGVGDLGCAGVAAHPPRVWWSRMLAAWVGRPSEARPRQFAPGDSFLNSRPYKSAHVSVQSSAGQHVLIHSVQVELVMPQTANLDRLSAEDLARLPRARRLAEVHSDLAPVLRS
jgi:hypothetical protein